MAVTPLDVVKCNIQVIAGYRGGRQCTRVQLLARPCSARKEVVVHHITCHHYFAQVDPKKYGGIVQGFKVISQEQGVAGLVRGWVPTLFGYSAQVRMGKGLSVAGAD